MKKLLNFDLGDNSLDTHRVETTIFDWDMLVAGKAISNGAPLSLLLIKEKFVLQASNARIGGTYSKELLSLQCGLVTLDIMKSQNGYQILSKIGFTIVQCFNSIVSKLGMTKLLSLNAVFNGALIDLRFDSKVYSNSNLLRSLRAFMIDNGIVILIGHPSYVSIAHASLDINDLAERFMNSICAWQTSREFKNYYSF